MCLCSKNPIIFDIVHHEIPVADLFITVLTVRITIYNAIYENSAGIWDPFSAARMFRDVSIAISVRLCSVALPM